MLRKFLDYLATLDVESINVENNKEHNATSVQFQYKKLSYLFVCENNDTSYFRLVLPNIQTITDDNRAKNIETINEINYNLKVVKGIIVGSNRVWLSVEQFVVSMENIGEVFSLALMVLEVAIAEYRFKFNND